MAVIKVSKHSYAQTVARLSRSIVSAGATLFATIDQSAAAAGAGLTLRPTTLLIFGNPKAGTKLMQSFPLIALELPLKILVWEEPGLVQLAYISMSELAARHNLDANDPVIRAIDQMLESLSESIQ